jgi:hypothetical protein
MVGGRAGTDYRSYASNYTLGDTDVRIGNMKSIFLDVVQAVRSVDPRGGTPSIFNSIELNRFQGTNLEGKLSPVATTVKSNTHPGPRKKYALASVLLCSSTRVSAGSEMYGRVGLQAETLLPTIRLRTCWPVELSGEA